METGTPLQLLYFSDSAKHLTNINNYLTEKGFSPDVKHIETLEKLEQEVADGYNIALILHSSKGNLIPAAIKIIKEKEPDLPIILITKNGDTGELPSEIESSISDIVGEANFSRLQFIINRELKVSSLKNEKKAFFTKTQNLNSELIKLENYKREEFRQLGEKISDILNKKKLVELDLHKSESMFKVFHEVSLEGLGVLTAIRNGGNEIYDYKIVYVNPSGAKMMLRNIDEVINSTVVNIFSKEVSPLIVADFNKVVETGDPCDVEYRVVYEGQVYWIRNLAVKMEDGIAVTFSDITKRKTIETEKDELIKNEKRALNLAGVINRQLVRSKEEYRIMGETIPFGIWKAKPDGTPEYASKSFLKLLGMTLEEACAKGWLWKIHPNDLYQMLKKWLTTVKTGSEWQDEYRVIDPEGQEHYILSKGLPVRNEAGQIESWVGINLDISSRVAIENKLKESSHRISEILNRVNDAFFALDKNWNITYLNKHSKEFNSLDVSHLGKGLWDVLPELVNTIYYQNYYKAMDMQIPVSFEAYGGYSNNWYLISVYPSVDGITVYAKDISDKKQAEDKLKITLKEKEVLLREVHHRVKNNLQVITSMLSLQANYLNDQTLIGRFMDTINRIRTMAIVHEQLYKSNKLSSIDFQKYITDLANKLFSSSKAPGNIINLEIECPEINIGVDDSINVGLIINEILLNSLKHAFIVKKRGTIRVIIQACFDSLLIDISDDGDGIANKVDIENSESFGMQLIHALVTQMGGSLKINSEKGTQFLINVKAKKHTEEAPEE